jgi:hypothetical protein
MRRVVFAVGLTMLCVPGSAGIAQQRYSGPWDPAAVAAAEQAVARLGAKTYLEISGTILSVPELLPQQSASSP